MIVQVALENFTFLKNNVLKIVLNKHLKIEVTNVNLVISIVSTAKEIAF